MTRQEEIWKAIFDLQIGDYDENKSPKDDMYDGSDIQSAFCKGAEWADANPKSPWISVKDDRPCLHEELISHHDKTHTQYVIAIVHGYITLSRMFKLEGKWHWEKDEPDYWFPIPKLPKEYFVIQEKVYN